MSISSIYDSANCAICWTDYDKDRINRCLVLKCGHIYHENCIRKAAEEEQSRHARPRCPLCRSWTFIPMLFKDVVVDSVQKAVRLAIPICKNGAVGLLAGTIYAAYYGIDLDVNQALKTLVGFTAISVIAAGVVVHKKRTTPAEVARQLDYIPPENI